jgi:GNAT superfamily N-acetyltransferase
MKKMNIDTHVILRSARRKDIKIIINFIRELAEYEHLSNLVEVDEINFKKYIFKEKMVEVIIAEYDNKPAGFALFFNNFSTFLGKPGIYIEDLFVKREFRGMGLGKHLLSYLAKLVLERNYYGSEKVKIFQRRYFFLIIIFWRCFVEELYVKKLILMIPAINGYKYPLKLTIEGFKNFRNVHKIGIEKNNYML